MPSKAATSTALKPMKLPPTKRGLAIRNPNSGEKNPCVAIMSSVLTCWASNGFNVSGCQGLEMQLRRCMDTPQPKPKDNSNVNYHLERFYPNIVSPIKRVVRWRDKR